jgi:elongation factor P--beta-lysine ligase
MASAGACLAIAASASGSARDGRAGPAVHRGRTSSIGPVQEVVARRCIGGGPSVLLNDMLSSALARGLAALLLCAAGSLGVTQPASAQQRFAVIIDSVPPRDSDSRSADFRFHVENQGGLAPMRCFLDGRQAPPSWCDSPVRYDQLAEGMHEFVVQAWNGFPEGPPDAAASYSWRVDLTPPDTRIDSAPPARTSSRSATFVASSNDPEVFDYACRLDASAFVSCDSTRTFNDLAEGAHTFEVYAIDRAGNADPTPDRYTCASLDRLGFTEISTPKIVASATESGANVFGLDYFGRRAFLAQSPQFYKQALVGAFERVYETGPVFRAEPHDTARHLAEYTSLDAELGFVGDHFDVMAVVRAVIVGMVDAIRERAGRALELLAVELPQVPDEIPWVHFADTGVEDVDLAPVDERRLCEEHGELVFVTGYPMAKRPFYTHPEPGRPQYSNSFDLLFRGLEIVTGGQRLHRYEDYVAALGGEIELYDSYLQPFRCGMPPHGGFALGLERWVARLTGARNIRETTLFPRDVHRLTP